jgi:hypothetical protein
MEIDGSRINPVLSYMSPCASRKGASWGEGVPVYWRYKFTVSGGGQGISLILA